MDFIKIHMQYKNEHERKVLNQVLNMKLFPTPPEYHNETSPFQNV